MTSIGTEKLSMEGAMWSVRVIARRWKDHSENPERFRPSYWSTSRN